MADGAITTSKDFIIFSILIFSMLLVEGLMEHALHDLRVGDLVTREMDNRGQTERHIGEVLSIRTRIQYLNVGYDWRECWDVTTASLHPFRPLSMPQYRLRKA